METNNYTQFLYSNRRYQSSGYSGQLVPFTFKSKEFQLFPKCRPLLCEGNLYGILNKNIVVSWSLRGEKINWEFDSSKHCEIESGEEYNIICVNPEELIVFQFPYLFALNTSGKEIWRKKISYSFYSEHTLVYEDSLVIFAVNRDLNSFLLHLNTQDLTMKEIPFEKKIVPDFLVADNIDASIIYIGHNNQGVSAVIDKFNLKTKKTEWSREYLIDNTNYPDKSKRSLYWQGRTVYWNNVIVSSIFNNRILAISSETGLIIWDLEITDQYSFSFDIKENKLQLLDGTFIKEIDLNTGEVLKEKQLSIEQNINEFHEYNTILNVNQNQLILGNLFKNKIGIIDVGSGELIWKEELDWVIESYCPVVTNNELLVYNSIEGKVKVFYNSR